jgi:ABC-type sugar transport system permease subunit
VTRRRSTSSGWRNSHWLLGKVEFWSALDNTGIFIAIRVPVIIVGSLAVAIALNGLPA